MDGDYAEQLKSFARSVGGSFNYKRNVTTTLRGGGWSRAEIKIPGQDREIFYLAFSGPGSAEVHSGFYAKANLPKELFCRVTQRDGFTTFISRFSSLTMQSGKHSFDKKLHTTCNDKSFLLKLTGNHDVSRFLETHIRRPLRFEVMNNEKGLLREQTKSTMLISLRANEWMVDNTLLNGLLDGFRTVVAAMG